ncbi:MAG: vitamin B12-dependent ribonucleotide reductase [Chloroflexota bacterium]|nr:vitamin B12-dependent ribonucleotide reductase [Chloroflexota bacterium]
MAASSGKKNGSLPFHNRIAREVFHYCESEGVSDRELVERLTEQVIQRLDHTHQRFPGMEVAIPEWRLGSAEIQTALKQIISEGDDLPKVLDETTHVSNVEGNQSGNGSKDQKSTSAKRKKLKVATSTAIFNIDAVEFSENAMRVLEKRYLRTDEHGKAIETPQDMFRRVAHDIASAETNYGTEEDAAHWEEEFYQLMANIEFLPNSPTLMNAGRELQQLSACFVLPIDDSMEGIFDAIKYTALIHKSGGGTGFSFSRLRPEGDTVGSTGKVASGPVSFMKVFDAATDVIKQGGMRRGANMAILNVNHPDIERFIGAKENNDSLTNFNLSVAATDEFMSAAEDGRDYDLIDPKDGSAYGRLSAKKVFDKIVEMAWKTGDPGLIFIDRVNRDNPNKDIGMIESTNPCGEQPLLPYESCNLGSINLARMVNADRSEVDYDKIEETVKAAVRFLDDVIDRNHFPLPEIAAMTRRTRKIGLGTMGFADMLIELGIPYDSDEALKIAESVMEFIDKTATSASVALAEERGVFPAFDGSEYGLKDGPRVRNATRTTIAPTGTLSIIANCSSGIEPLFALSYMRHILDGDALVEVNPYFEEAARNGGFYSEQLMRDLATKGSLHDIKGIPEEVNRVFVTAHDISPKWHVKMQSAFQRGTNNAVSKTINFPQSATKDDIAQAYRLAYKEGCKGITIYRDRSKDKQVLSVSGKDDQEQEKLVTLEPRKRARITTGVTERVATGCGNIYVTVNSDDQGICEVFSSLGKAGGCASAQLEATCRLISLALRSGVDVAAVVRHIRGIRCPSIAWEQGHSILSCPDAIATVLGRQISAEEGETVNIETAKDESVTVKAKVAIDSPTVNSGGQCPDCGGILVYQEGCQTCHSCGYTKCS